MHIIAISSSFATSIDVLLAFGVEKISHRGKDSTNLFAIEESSIDVIESIFRILLVAVFDINIAYYVISKIVDYNHVFNLAVLTHLFEHIFKKCLKSKNFINNYLVSAFSASSSLTMLPEIIAVSTALFSYICSRRTVQLIGGLLWILSQLSPYLHAPILQKKGQLTLSISVPQTLDSLSAII